MKFRNYAIDLAIVFFICFNFLTPVLGDDWMVEKEEELVFDLIVWNEGDITADGSLTLTIEDINSTGELMYFINTDFEIDEIDLEDDFEVDNANTTDLVSILTMKVPHMVFVALLWSEDRFDDYVDQLADIVEGREDFYEAFYGDNDSITYSVKELEYGIEDSLEDTELEESRYIKWQWDQNGILKHFERTKIENNEKTGFLITKKEFNIPSFSMEVFLAICAISTIGIIIRSKKHK